MKITHSAPDPDGVISDLRSVLQTIMVGLDKGATDARQIHRDRNFRFDFDLANSVVRKWVKHELLGHSLVAKEFILDENVRNIGLHLDFTRDEVRYHVKMWKTADGDLPYPGQSLRKRQFLDNYQQGRLLGDEFCPEWDDVNLVVLWSVTGSYELDSLFLVLPKAAPKEFYGRPEAWWSRKLPHLAEFLPTTREPDGETQPLPYEKPDEEDGAAEENR